ncbi:MAG: hypothetical protein V1702_05665 [Candidatus Woesearchaeota archaeon]
MKPSKKSQVATEASAIFTFMTLVFIVVLLFVGNRLVDITTERNRELINDLGSVITAEFTLASQSQSGYHREFTLPETLKGIEYNVSILTSGMTNTNFSSLVINVTGEQYVYLMPKDISGNMCRTKRYTLDKQNSTVVVSCIGYECQFGEETGSCSVMEGLGLLVMAQCCSDYGFCCV